MQTVESAPCILVADDNPLSLHFLADALGFLGFAVVRAADGAIAAQRARDHVFDLLLLDARMPRLDGPAALARIRSEAGASRTAPALATTADDNALTRADLLAAGFLDVLVKPLGIDALRDALAHHVAPAPSRAIDASCEHIDEAHALDVAGGDGAIVAALRGLLLRELEHLPAELDAMAAHCDTQALDDRLHRLDASAGFCGVPALAQACTRLRAAAAASAAWPHAALNVFVQTCADCARRLDTF